MFAESLSSTLSIWASINSWFTPTVLFLVVNLVIGTIAVASHLGASPKPTATHRHSLLHRLNSINPYSYTSQDPPTVFHNPPATEPHYVTNEHPQLARSPSVLERFKFGFSGYKSEEADTRFSDYEHPQLARSPSVLERFKFSFPEVEEAFQSPPPVKASGDETRFDPQLMRSPSVLQRLGFNFNGFKSEEPFQSPTLVAEAEKTSGIETHFAPRLVRSPSMLQRLRFNFNGFKSEEEKTSGIETDSRGFEATKLVRSPSMLQRLRFNFSGAKSEESVHPPPPPPPSSVQIQETDEYEEEEEPTMDEIYSKLHGGDHFTRTKSDTKPTAGEFPTRLPQKMKKSASSKSAFQHFEADEIVETRRPATVKEGRDKPVEIDDEVDARADDFINKFKQQLQLQRLDSILKYKEMVNRGNAK